MRLPFCLTHFLFMDEAPILAFGGQLLHGGLHGLDIVDTRGPGGPYIAAIIAFLFGYGNIIAYHLTGLLFNLLTLIMIFYLASKLYDNKIAQLSCLLFAIFSYSYKLIDSLSFNVESMALPFLMLASIIFYDVFLYFKNSCRRISSKAIFSCLMVGILGSIVFSIKQVIAACFIAYFVIIFVDYYLSGLRIKQVLLITSTISVGFLIGLLGIFGRTIITTGWENTIYWSFFFGYRHYTKPILDSLVSSTNLIFTLYLAQPLFWLLSLVWLIKSMSSFIKKPIKNNIGELYLFLLIVTQILGALIPGRKAFHYLVPLIPFLSIAVSKTIIDYFYLLDKSLKKPLIIFILLVAVLPPIMNYTIFPAGLQAFEYNLYASFMKETDKTNPLNRAVKIIKNNTTENDTIYVVSNGYEFYLLSKRLPSTIALHLWYFNKYKEDAYLKKAYNKIIADIVHNHPKVIIQATRNFFEGDNFKDLKKILDTQYKVQVIDSKSEGLGKNEFFSFGKTFDYIEIYIKNEHPT